MGKPPTGPETAPPAESPLKKEFRRLARLSHFLKLGERTTIASSVIGGKNDRTTMQRVTRYEDFLPLANAEQEARFRAVMHHLADLLVQHGALLLTPDDCRILETVARQKQTNLATILSIITNRAVLCEGHSFRLLSDAEVAQMLAQRNAPAGILDTFTALIKRVLRG